MCSKLSRSILLQCCGSTKMPELWISRVIKNLWTDLYTLNTNPSSFALCLWWNQGKPLKLHDKILCPKILYLPNGSSFTLNSVINHIGEIANSGHYNIAIFDENEDSITLLDDSQITNNVNFEDLAQICYVATYTRIWINNKFCTRLFYFEFNKWELNKENRVNEPLRVCMYGWNILSGGIQIWRWNIP